MMRRVRRFGFCQSLALVLATAQSAAPAFAATAGQASRRQASDSVTATVTVASRSSLQVSSQILHFEISDPSAGAEASIEFAAGARARVGDDVVLIVELTEPMSMPANTTMGPLTIVGASGAGVLAPGQPVAAARWNGGGLRTGRVTFRRQAAPGRYDVPLTFGIKVRPDPTS